MIGLNAGTGLKLAVLGGIITIAIADSFSDALGIHISEESQKKNSQKAIWEATITTFFTKLIIALTFILPVILLELRKAIIISIIWGFSLISIFIFVLAKRRVEYTFNAVSEHLLIATIVVITTNYVGKAIAFFFT